MSVSEIAATTDNLNGNSNVKLIFLSNYSTMSLPKCLNLTYLSQSINYNLNDNT